jgi:hypothetical protein
MTDKSSPEAQGQALDIGALVHSSAGIISLLMGALMYFYDWALPIFAGLMILSAVSAVAISWHSNAWVPGHWLAMLPVAGIAIGYFIADWGYTMAYIFLWIAFAHFVIRGVQAMRETKVDS